MIRQLILRHATLSLAISSALLSIVIGYGYGSWSAASKIDKASLNAEASFASIKRFFEIGKRSGEPYSSFNLSVMLLEEIETTSIDEFQQLIAEISVLQIERVKEYCANRASTSYRNSCFEKLNKANEYTVEYGSVKNDKE